MLTKSSNGVSKAVGAVVRRTDPEQILHPVWHQFVRYCTELQHGQIEVLKIQDGLPVLAEVTKKKVKFAP